VSLKVRFRPVLGLLVLAISAVFAQARSGGVALRSTDYPLPAAYNRAFDASSRIALEVAPKALENSSASLLKAGKYSSNDSLKNYVDPRAYDYLRRVFGLQKIPENKFSRYRPWLLVFLLDSPGMRGFSQDLGVDESITNRARANGKQIVGLKSASEHNSVFAGLNDRQSEALLLVQFIPTGSTVGERDQMMAAWRRGDVDVLARSTLAAYADFPAFGERILGGSNGLLALMRARNCKVKQL
jgi:uncharacterized protein YbaP (TraB family)